MREREQRAEARSIARLLHPRRSRSSARATTRARSATRCSRNLLRMGFDGPLYPVNPDARHVGGVRAYPSVLDVPDDDRPRRHRRAGGRGARRRRPVRGSAACAGWSSSPAASASAATDERAGRRPRRPSASWCAAARAHGMRVVGPNCLGVVNTEPDVRLNASLAPLPPLRRPGRLLLPVRRARRGRPRRGGPARARRVDVRVGRQPRRRVRQRPAAVLGDRRAHRRRPDVPGELRQPAQVRPAGPPARPHEADRRGEERRRRRAGGRAGADVGRGAGRSACGRCSRRPA